MSKPPAGSHAADTMQRVSAKPMAGFAFRLTPTLMQTCSACGNAGMHLISAPRPEYVTKCQSCGSAFFEFGSATLVSHTNQYNAANEYQEYLAAANEPSLTQRYAEAIYRLRKMLADCGAPSLFDIGAGGGDFLQLASQSGFRVAGNEVSQPAIDECRARHGIDLIMGDDLQLIAKSKNDYDVVTMWCVIAHVDQPEELLRGVRALMRPGAVLFLSTPRYCFIDRIALFLRWITRDRYRRAFDRRINEFHRRQYSVQGIDALLRRERFEPVSIAPTIGYGLHMEDYLRSIGLPQRLSGPLGKLLESAACAGLAPRNVVSVYARAV